MFKALLLWCQDQLSSQFETTYTKRSARLKSLFCSNWSTQEVPPMTLAIKTKALFSPCLANQTALSLASWTLVTNKTNPAFCPSIVELLRFRMMPLRAVKIRMLLVSMSSLHLTKVPSWPTANWMCTNNSITYSSAKLKGKSSWRAIAKVRTVSRLWMVAVACSTQIESNSLLWKKRMQASAAIWPACNSTTLDSWTPSIQVVARL